MLFNPSRNDPNQNARRRNDADRNSARYQYSRARAFAGRAPDAATKHVRHGPNRVWHACSERWRDGDSGGAGPNAQGGTGGGEVFTIKPLGFIELKAGHSRFRPIRRSVVPLVAVSGLVALLLLRAVPRLLPGRKPPGTAGWPG